MLLNEAKTRLIYDVVNYFDIPIEQCVRSWNWRDFSSVLRSFATLFLLSSHELIYFLYAAAFTFVRTTINGSENRSFISLIELSRRK